jgi:hypothetical protein
MDAHAQRVAAASLISTPCDRSQAHLHGPALPSRRALWRCRVHRIPRPTSVTIAIRPSVGWDGERSRSDLGQARTEIFLQMGLDSQFTDLPVGQINRPVQPAAASGSTPTTA